MEANELNNKINPDVPVIVPNDTQVANQKQFFFDNNDTAKKITPQEAVDKTGELVGAVLHEGIVHKVKTDETVREKVLDTADKVIKTHLDVEKSRADKADKKAFFEANEAACTYFGYDEQTTSKSHVSLMKGWAWFFNTLYIVTIGFFLVAPIVFFAAKLRVVIKKNWIVLILAILIYAGVALSPLILSWVTGAVGK